MVSNMLFLNLLEPNDKEVQIERTDTAKGRFDDCEQPVDRRPGSYIVRGPSRTRTQSCSRCYRGDDEFGNQVGRRALISLTAGSGRIPASHRI